MSRYEVSFKPPIEVMEKFKNSRCCGFSNPSEESKSEVSALVLKDHGSETTGLYSKIRFALAGCMIHSEVESENLYYDSFKEDGTITFFGDKYDCPKEYIEYAEREEEEYWNNLINQIARELYCVAVSVKKPDFFDDRMKYFEMLDWVLEQLEIISDVASDKAAFKVFKSVIDYKVDDDYEDLENSDPEVDYMHI